MTGLDKILEQIKIDSESTSGSIEQQCDAQIKEILAKAEQDGKKEAAAISAKAEAECKDIKERSKSACQLEISKAILNTKQTVINKALLSGVNAVKNLPQAEYFELILKMIKKNNLDKDGLICFGEKDIKRLPNNFSAEIQKISPKLTISEKAANIDSGFILIYGMVEENCSFDAIFSDLSEQLTDEAAEILFS